MYWIYDIPNWLLGLLIVIVFVAISTVGMFLTRRWMRRVHVQRSHNDIVGFYLAGIAVLYGVTLGLLAIAAWTTYTEAEGKVAQEAADLSSLYQSVGSLPQPRRELLRNDLRNYTRQVIDVGWPSQERGIPPVQNDELLDKFLQDFQRSMPAGEAETVREVEILREFDALEESRSIRLDSATEGLAPGLWGLILIGALICIIVPWFFHMESLSMHFWMGALYSTLLGLMIFMVAALDNPYRGRISVGPQPFERLYSQITKSVR